MISKLELENGSVYEGTGFGDAQSVSGELVFNTGIVGYAESMTDPSYSGQVLVFTYPLIGNYGIAGDETEKGMPMNFESEKIHTKAIVVNTLSEQFSHWKSVESLDSWMKKNGVAGISGIDTRALTIELREHGSMLCKLTFRDRDPGFHNPNLGNLVSGVSVTEPKLYEAGSKTVVLIDCGSKLNIIRCFLDRGVSVLRVPWNYDFFGERYDGVMISNGPGDPSMVGETTEIIRKCFSMTKPVFGICLGHQLMALAAGASTYKLRFGHRSQNQPCVMTGSKRCFITSQNHGFAVDETKLDKDWKPYFFNANDGSNEGIRHATKPFFSAQFHPEATPGPVDTEFLFDQFIDSL